MLIHLSRLRNFYNYPCINDDVLPPFETQNLWMCVQTYFTLLYDARAQDGTTIVL